MEKEDLHVEALSVRETTKSESMKDSKEYSTTLINFAKYKLVMFTMAKIMEIEELERNKIVLYLFNSIKA